MAELTPGALVRQRREQRQLSRERLARQADVSSATIVRLELHEQLPNVAALGRITRELDLTIDELLSAATGGAA